MDICIISFMSLYFRHKYTRVLNNIMLFIIFRVQDFLSAVSNIMIILSSGAMGYNVIGEFRWIFHKC